MRGASAFRRNEHHRKETAVKIGILGTGRMGVRLAAMYARAGHEVVLGSRDTERSRRIAAGPRPPRPRLRRLRPGARRARRPARDLPARRPAGPDRTAAHGARRQDPH
ncbi:NAD(P)-binding domain-containing protein [Actinomadura sp.]|uniref:NAD(P)-binding domain-containing protein n=1 Tax=Actinomadura sp. TaxID=1989 RepID=UPI0037CC62AC